MAVSTTSHLVMLLPARCKYTLHFYYVINQYYFMFCWLQLQPSMPTWLVVVQENAPSVWCGDATIGCMSFSLYSNAVGMLVAGLYMYRIVAFRLRIWSFLLWFLSAVCVVVGCVDDWVFAVASACSLHCYCSNLYVSSNGTVFDFRQSLSVSSSSSVC